MPKCVFVKESVHVYNPFLTFKYKNVFQIFFRTCKCKSIAKNKNITTHNNKIEFNFVFSVQKIITYNYLIIQVIVLRLLTLCSKSKL